MHTTALENGKLFFDTYVKNKGDITVIDIGSQDVNGTLKSVAPSNVKYIGVDMEAAKGVDIVLSDPYKLPFADNSIDAIVSSSCFEHSEMFWVLFLEMMRILKPDGLCYINAPSNWNVHRYPLDCWRFYPDAGHALVTWAKYSGYNPLLLESYISDKTDKNTIEEWEDFVAIFLKDEKYIKNFENRIQHSIKNVKHGFIG
jgi:ubiquinone/menaquinone biosynthesis C-methylase UbiE